MRLLVHLMRLSVLAVITSWLLFLALWIWALQFNEYGDLGLVDCDKDAESLLMMFLTLLWSTTALIWPINLIFKYRYHDQSFRFIGRLSAFLSIVFIPKFIGLMQYNAALIKQCP